MVWRPVAIFPDATEAELKGLFHLYDQAEAADKELRDYIKGMAAYGAEIVERDRAKSLQRPRKKTRRKRRRRS